MTVSDDRTYPASATVAGQEWSNEDIRAFELDRARHALAYVKAKLGNDAMRQLIADDTTAMKEQARAWLRASDRQWQTGEVELRVPGPTADQFFAWYKNAFLNTHEPELRAGHPEHWVSHPRGDGAEVVENIGETALPWRVLYRTLAPDGGFPTPWPDDYPVRFGSEVVDEDGTLIGYTMHALRDDGDSVRIRMISNLPAAMPADVMHHHLRHYCIEFRNWSRSAQRWIDDGGHDVFGTGLGAGN